MTAYSRWLSLGLISLSLTGCASSKTKDDAEDAGLPAPEGPACFAHEVTAELATQAVQNVDIVFAIDNSESMGEEQAALAAQFARMIAVLSSGDRDEDGVADFSPARSLHLAVVSTDLGLPGVDGVPGCAGVGDDGRFNRTASAEVAGCSTTSFDPPFLTFSSDDGDDPASAATDLACLGTLGLDGCTIEQPLESLLKAVWPASNTDVTFLAETGTTAGGQVGPGAPNGEFFRDDPADGPSVIALVVVTDEDDCSVRDTAFLAPGASSNGIDTRCFFEAARGLDSSIFAVDRYIQTFKQLRRGDEDQVIFAGIVGVPEHLTTPDVLSQYDLFQPNDANAFYDMLLSAPEMFETVDSRGNADPADDRLLPSCSRAGDQLAFPPRRIVQVAKGFGANGIVQSICRDDLGPTIDPIIAAISSKLGVPCLPRPIARNSEGLIDCHVTWQLGSGSGEIEQLAVDPSGGEPRGDGWYYDDFSDVTQQSCIGPDAQRIAFTESGRPPDGATTRLHCFRAEYYLESNRTDLRNDVEQPEVGSRCDLVRLRNQEVSGDDACVQLLVSNEEDRRMFCDDSTNRCALSCSEDADCPDLWFCDDRPETVNRAGGTMCSPGTCSAGPTAASAELVGDPCLTLYVPEDGFDDSSAYVEGNHPHCDGGACIVYHLAGDPRENCIGRAGGPDGVRCAAPQEIEERVYCSCRCDAPEGFAECDCPDGFSCVELMDNAPPEITGGYCVRDGSVAQ